MSTRVVVDIDLDRRGDIRVTSLDEGDSFEAGVAIRGEQLKLRVFSERPSTIRNLISILEAEADRLEVLQKTDKAFKEPVKDTILACPECHTPVARSKMAQHIVDEHPDV